MTIALVAHTGFASGTSGGTTSAINTTGADFIVANVTSAAIGTISFSDILAAFSDSLGNTWTSNITGGAPGGSGNILIYALAPTVGSSQTFTCSLTNLFGVFQVAAFSNVTSADQNDIGFGSGGTAGTIGSAITPANSNSLVISSCSVNDTSVPTIDSGFTITDQAATLGGNYVGGGLGYLVQTAASAVDPTWSWTGSSGWSVILADFNPSITASPVRAGFFHVL